MLKRLLKIKTKSEYIRMGAKKYIADMETNGVYFSDEQRKVMEEIREREMCQYSGLPSVASYASESEYYVGHS